MASATQSGRSPRRGLFLLLIGAALTLGTAALWQPESLRDSDAQPRRSTPEVVEEPAPLTATPEPERPANRGPARRANTQGTPVPGIDALQVLEAMQRPGEPPARQAPRGDMAVIGSDEGMDPPAGLPPQARLAQLQEGVIEPALPLREQQERAVDGWAELDRSFQSESYDPAWTNEMRTFLDETATATGLGPETLASAECRTSVCRVKLAFASPLEAAEFQAAAQTPAYRFQVQPLSAGQDGEPAQGAGSAMQFEGLVSRNEDHAGAATQYMPTEEQPGPEAPAVPNGAAAPPTGPASPGLEAVPGLGPAQGPS